MVTKKSATHKPRKKNGDVIDGSPVTVGGGGGIGPFVELEFDHNDYVPDPDDQDNFINPDLTLVEIQINDQEPLELSPHSEIVIQFQKGGNRKVTITADPPDTPLGVRFNPKHLKYNHQQKKHRDDGSVLKKLTVDGMSTNLNEDDQIIIRTI